MAKRRVKYIRKMNEIHGENPNRIRKGQKKHGANLARTRHAKDMIIGGPGSRKIRRNMLKALPGYKNKYMSNAWGDHQRKTYGAEIYRMLVECAKKKKDRSDGKIAVYFRKLRLRQLGKAI